MRALPSLPMRFQLRTDPQFFRLSPTAAPGRSGGPFRARPSFYRVKLFCGLSVGANLFLFMPFAPVPIPVVVPLTTESTLCSARGRSETLLVSAAAKAVPGTIIPAAMVRSLNFQNQISLDIFDRGTRQRARRRPDADDIAASRCRILIPSTFCLIGL